MPHSSDNQKIPDSSFWKEDRYYILDQLLLPGTVKYIECLLPEEVAQTIINMNLRGAPLIGAAASAAIALYFKNGSNKCSKFSDLRRMLISTRPTAVNLKNIVDEAEVLFKNSSFLNNKSLFELFSDFSKEVHKRDRDRNFAMGENGAEYLNSFFSQQKLKVLTHCNAGALATCGYGTALGVIRSLNSRGLLEHVWVDETRPYFQGVRLTAFEMVCENIPHTVVTDSSAAWLMHEKEIDVVITGADRIVLNGDTANKIGTYSLAVNSQYHGIPFLIAAPVETFDLISKDGSSIVIEERSDTELLEFNGKRIAPDASKGLHLGFDIVPAELITAVVTEKKVVTGPITSEKILETANE